MALSRVQYVQSVSGNRNFTVPFPYISRDDVKVSVDGEEATFSWLSTTLIQLATAPAVGIVIDINRETNRETLLVDFTDGSTITENQLDLSARQSFYLAQETLDTATANLGVSEDGSYSAGTRRISNLGDPDSDDDAATQGYVKQVLTTDAAGYASAAASSASSASTSASQATTARASAESLLETFQGEYWGAYASEPTVDPNGDTPDTGDLYFHIGMGMKIYNGSGWQFISPAFDRWEYTTASSQSAFAFTPGTVSDVKVWVNGLLLLSTDYTVTSGTVTLDTSVPAGTDVIIEARIDPS